MCIKWGQFTSCFFLVSNGVSQGGILSPGLFAVYVEDSSKQLGDARSGCFIGHQYINHVMYADDICLLAPSVLGLQKLLEMCYDYSQDNDILFNFLKNLFMLSSEPKDIGYFVHLCICIKKNCVAYMKLSIWDIF